MRKREREGGNGPVRVEDMECDPLNEELEPDL